MMFDIGPWGIINVGIEAQEVDSVVLDVFVPMPRIFTLE